MNNRNVFSFLFVLSLLLVACGGGSSPSPSPSPSPSSPAAAQVSNSSRPGMHIHDVRRTTAHSFRLFDWGNVVYAQSNVTVVVSQNWEGHCNTSPAPGTGQAFVSYPIFGVGQSSQASCLNFFTDTDGSVAAANASDSKLVFGAGTISNLIVSTGKGTSIVSAGVPVKIWVSRNNSIQFTGLTCTIPSGAGELICQGTATFSAQNLDRVIATATKGDGDVLVNLSVNFTKSVP